MRYEALLDAALRLPAGERGALARRLLDSLEIDQTEVDPATWETEWSEELQRRLAKDDGQRFDLGETLAELRAGLDRRG